MNSGERLSFEQQQAIADFCSFSFHHMTMSQLRNEDAMEEIKSFLLEETTCLEEAGLFPEINVRRSIDGQKVLGKEKLIIIEDENVKNLFLPLNAITSQGEIFRFQSRSYIGATGEVILDGDTSYELSAEDYVRTDPDVIRTLQALKQRIQPPVQEQAS